MEWEEVEGWKKDMSTKCIKGSTKREEVGLKDGESAKNQNGKEVWRGELKDELKTSTSVEKSRKSDKGIEIVDVDNEGKGGMEGKKCEFMKRGEGGGRRDEKERVSEYSLRLGDMNVSKATVVYGSISLVDEMLIGMHNFNLKRQGEELEDVKVGKKMKISINSKSVKAGVMKQYVAKKMISVVLEFKKEK